MKKKWNWKEFGCEQTHLRRSDFSDKALATYEDTDPLHIYEEKQDDGEYLYYVCGSFETDHGLTFSELNDLLEAVYDEDHDEDQ